MNRRKVDSTKTAISVDEFQQNAQKRAHITKAKFGKILGEQFFSNKSSKVCFGVFYKFVMTEQYEQKNKQIEQLQQMIDQQKCQIVLQTKLSTFKSEFTAQLEKKFSEIEDQIKQKKKCKDHSFCRDQG